MQVKTFLSAVEQDRVIEAIRKAEACSTGEIRVHVSEKPVDDAQKVAEAQFVALGMTATNQRNGILIYIAPTSQKFAIVGDSGIHARCGPEFWRDVASVMGEDFRAGRFTDGIVKGVAKAGDVLAVHFPRADGCDVNELSDNVTHD